MSAYRLSDFDYHLPPELIAQVPTASRSASRLLAVKKNGALEDRTFLDLPTFLKAGDLLVFNDSKVIPARLRALKETGGMVELLVERVISPTTAQVMLRASKTPRAGATLTLVKPGNVSCEHVTVEKALSGPSSADLAHQSRSATLIGRDPSHDDRFIVDFKSSVFAVLDEFGELPLPPYIRHTPNHRDNERYQTVYAQNLGSVAAPTAGLHFDEAMLERLSSIGVQMAQVTLHVGSGTFSPVRSEDLSQHRMHSEWCSISADAAQKISQAKQEGCRVIAVGTTSLRTLESAAARSSLAGAWETELFITPGYKFRMANALLTNFHLPKSTLLMLVSAFAGYEKIRKAYAHAIEQEYRFFSYGDAMFLERS